LKDQRKLSVPVYFNSTIDVGLHNSIVLNLLIAAGAAAVASNDSDMGSSNLQ
jgi:glutaminase